VIQAYEAGEGSYPAIGRRFSVGEATVKRWIWRFHKEGKVAPRPRGGGTPSITASVLAALLARFGDPTAGELTAEFNRGRRGRARVHVSSMKRSSARLCREKSADGRWRVCAPTSL
jgi:hypothetical protein